ncbi:triacylglycerol lipase 1 [Olea europaea subsp. europaea]|uniref:Triacylglycerol lipase 1 n=1 Tax=Olea europaea subsp. europaea TaxID=158383 RepID=A0A8S0TI00_OLEEU|nr:triacylglycerol lipase 1 [Olea europaea subsp. europaea]
MMVALFSSALLSSVEDFANASNLRRPEAGLCAQLIESSGFPCSEHKTLTKDGFILGIQRVSSNSGDFRWQRGPPVLLIHGLFVAGNAWFFGYPKSIAGLILADRGFDLKWLGKVRQHQNWSSSQLLLNQLERRLCLEFWGWSWQELALYDLGEMIRYVYSVTNSRVFIVGHLQGTIISLAAFTQPDIVEMVGAAALLSVLCPITYLKHITARLPLKLVKMHLAQVVYLNNIASSALLYNLFATIKTISSTDRLQDGTLLCCIVIDVAPKQAES